MAGTHSRNGWIVWLTFAIGLLLSVSPLPQFMEILRPLWLALLPHREHTQPLLQRQHQERDQREDQRVLAQQGAIQHIFRQAQEQRGDHADFMRQVPRPECQQQCQPQRAQDFHELR